MWMLLIGLKIFAVDCFARFSTQSDAMEEVGLLRYFFFLLKTFLHFKAPVILGCCLVFQLMMQ